MPTSAPVTTWPEHYRLRYEGYFDGGAGPVERWSFGLNIARTGQPLQPVPQRELPSETDFILNQALPCIRHIFGGTIIANNAVCDSIKFNRINNLGHYFDSGHTHQSNNTYSNWGAEIRGGGGLLKYPTEIAMVISLATDVARGPAHHGRFYLPSPSRQIAADTRLSVVDAQGYANTVRDALVMLEVSINGSLDQFGPVVVSPISSPGGGSLDPGAGTVRPVTEVAAGRVLDVMRSRRRSLPEDYQSVSLA